MAKILYQRPLICMEDGPRPSSRAPGVDVRSKRRLPDTSETAPTTPEASMRCCAGFSSSTQMALAAWSVEADK
jgi:hypothetical protein